jgi:thiamine biosynthesis protein ThiS
MITLTVNGKLRETDGPVDLKRYLLDIGITQTAIAVAHNGTVIPRTEVESVTLQDGDTLEIVRAVGGG